jgi:hypothetical protein
VGPETELELLNSAMTAAPAHVEDRLARVNCGANGFLN